MINTHRRSWLKTAGSGLLGLTLAGCASDLLPKRGRRVVVVGGGFGGMTVSRHIRQLDDTIEVVLVERQQRYVASPSSNQVVTGWRNMESLTVDYRPLAVRHGVQVLHAEVTSIAPDDCRIDTSLGRLHYDRLIFGPGITFLTEAIAGYDQTTPDLLPHAWQAGPQTLLLQRQLAALPDGGTVLLSIPAAPYRCPPGPYERVCLIAEYLKRHKPRSKIIILDANSDIVTQASLFRNVWHTRYRDRIDYMPDMRITRVDGPARTLYAEDGNAFRGDVVNFIPPQYAGPLAARTGLIAGEEHWCPISAREFESIYHPGIHVIGDAAQADAMPKSAYAANVQAKFCAMNVVARLNGHNPQDFVALNACYAAIGPDEAISITGAYRAAGRQFQAIPESGTRSPADLSWARREHLHAESWLRNMLAELRE